MTIPGSKLLILTLMPEAFDGVENARHIRDVWVKKSVSTLLCRGGVRER